MESDGLRRSPEIGPAGSLAFSFFLLASPIFDFPVSRFQISSSRPTVRQLAFCEDDLAVNLNRTQILGALILAAIALAILLLRWKFAH
jgi:hypothetical protein